MSPGTWGRKFDISHIVVDNILSMDNNWEDMLSDMVIFLFCGPAAKSLLRILYMRPNVSEKNLNVGILDNAP